MCHGHHFFWPYKISIFSENISGDRVIRCYDCTMQNFDDLDIEGRNPHVSEEAKEKVSKECVLLKRLYI